MTLRRAFTFVEVAVVLIILGILAAMVVPRFGGITDDARTASVQGTVNGVRASIAAYRTNALLAGNPPFPALKELLAPGLVLQSDIPPNPFTGVGGVREVSSKAGMYRLVGGATTWTTALRRRWRFSMPTRRQRQPPRTRTESP